MTVIFETDTHHRRFDMVTHLEVRDDMWIIRQGTDVQIIKTIEQFFVFTETERYRAVTVIL